LVSICGGLGGSWDGVAFENVHGNGGWVLVDGPLGDRARHLRRCHAVAAIESGFAPAAPETVSAGIVAQRGRESGIRGSERREQGEGTIYR
jgi:hypothetical protein